MSATTNLVLSRPKAKVGESPTSRLNTGEWTALREYVAARRPLDVVGLEDSVPTERQDLNRLFDSASFLSKSVFNVSSTVTCSMSDALAEAEYGFRALGSFPSLSKTVLVMWGGGGPVGWPTPAVTSTDDEELLTAVGGLYDRLLSDAVELDESSRRALYDNLWELYDAEE